jgi:protein-tyrosine phosphatase
VETAVVHVEIDPVAHDDSLLVRWQLEGEPVAVDVAIGTSADHLDHRHETTIPPGETSSRLRRIPSGRMFVSVACHQGGPAVVAAERRIPFEAVTNFRDLGGYRTRSGRRIRWGRVFRSDALHGMTEGDVAMYDDLGLTAVFDLRGDVEVAEQPDPMPSRHLPMISRPAGDNIASAFNGSTGEDGERLLAGLYIGQIDNSATTIGELFSALAEPGGLPAVFHCHAGKDRTGLVAAVLLEALGVEREAILDDYELTARYRLRAQQDQTFERMINLGLGPEAAAGVLTAPRWAMQSALEHLDREYGDVERYLTGRAAMELSTLERLSAELLTA